MSDIVIYENKDIKVDVLIENETVWLTQKQMSELFDKDRSTITKHINNIFKEGELIKESNVQNMHIANSDKPVKFYNLDVIISVGYRVKSMYLDFAELRALDKKVMYMKDWVIKLDAFLQFNEKEVLEHKGKISHEVAVTLALCEYERYNTIEDKNYISDFDKLLLDMEK